jgi:hypothetical protein
MKQPLTEWCTIIVHSVRLLLVCGAQAAAAAAAERSIDGCWQRQRQQQGERLFGAASRRDLTLWQRSAIARLYAIWLKSSNWVVLLLRLFVGWEWAQCEQQQQQPFVT